jgi:hypothetical protein
LEGGEVGVSLLDGFGVCLALGVFGERPVYRRGKPKRGHGMILIRLGQPECDGDGGVAEV